MVYAIASGRRVTKTKNITFEDDPPELPKRVMHRKTRWMIFFMKHDEQEHNF